MSALRIEDLYCQHQQQAVLSGVSLTVADNEILCLLGASGGGKTTLLRAIAGLMPVSQGTVWLRGRQVEGAGMSVPAEQRETGFIFQDYALFPHLTVAQNLAFALRPLRLSGEQQRQRIQEMLSLVALTSLAQRYPHELSGGQQQRVAIARALVCRPQLLLLDEPFSNIDAQVRWSLIREIRALLKSLNMAAVFVTHSKEEAFAFADRLALLEKGRVVQIGTPKQLYHQPASPYVAEFLGRGNLVRCDWLAAGHLASALGEIRVESDPAACPEPLLFVRPQLLAVTPGGQGAVLEQQFLGSHVRCLIDWQGEQYEAWHHEWLTEPECGVSLALRPHAPVLFSRTEWPQLHSRL